MRELPGERRLERASHHIGKPLDGSPRCSACGRTATHHVMWSDRDVTDGAALVTALCESDYLDSALKWSIEDEHRFGPVCHMPGTIWRAATPDQPSCCLYPGDKLDKTLEQVREAVDTLTVPAEPVPAGAVA